MMTRSRRLTLSALLCASMAGACQRGAATATPTKPVSPDVWATVDGREIHRDDVEKAYRGVTQQTPTPPSEEEVLTVKLGIVDELITQDIVLARAKALALDVTDADVDKTFNERKGTMSDAAFQLQVSQRGLSVDDMKRGVRRELVVQKVFEREIASKISVTDKDISDYYAQNRAQFNVAEPQYRIAQIVITPFRDPQARNRMNDDAATPAEAMKKVQMLAEKLKGGADFGEVAMDYSEDPQTVAQGGDLGFVPASALNKVSPQLRDAVIKAEPGTINTVSLGGAHTLVLLVAKESAGQRELSTPAVQDAIRNTLQERKAQMLRTAYVANIRNDAKIVNYLARLVVDAQGKPPSLAPTAPGK